MNVNDLDAALQRALDLLRQAAREAAVQTRKAA